MESNQIIAELRERSEEAQQAAIALAGGLEAITRSRSLHELCEAAALLQCEQCGAAAGTPCSRGLAGPGQHVARFAEARRRGLLTEAEMADLLEGLDAFTNATIVRDSG
jgi:hypothetical protein